MPISKLDGNSARLIGGEWADNLNDKLTKTGARVHALRVALKQKQMRMYGEALDLLRRLLQIARIRDLANKYWLANKDSTIITIASTFKFSHRKRGLEKLSQLMLADQKRSQMRSLTRFAKFAGVNCSKNPKVFVYSLSDLINTNQLLAAFTRLKYQTTYEWMLASRPNNLKINVLHAWKRYSQLRRGFKMLFYYPFQRSFFTIFRNSLKSRMIAMAANRIERVLHNLAARTLLGLAINSSTSLAADFEGSIRREPSSVPVFVPELERNSETRFLQSSQLGMAPTDIKVAIKPELTEGASLLDKIKAAKAQLSRNHSQKSLLIPKRPQLGLLRTDTHLQPTKAEDATRAASGELDGHLSPFSERFFKVGQDLRGFKQPEDPEDAESSVPLQNWQQKHEERRASMSNTERAVFNHTSSRSMLRAEHLNGALSSSNGPRPLGLSGLKLQSTLTERPSKQTKLDAGIWPAAHSRSGSLSKKP